MGLFRHSSAKGRKDSERLRSSSSAAGFTERGAKMIEATDDYGPRDFDVADLDGNMIFFGTEIPKT